MVAEAKRMQGYGSDFIKEMFAAAKNPDMISFAGGAPAPELYAHWKPLGLHPTRPLISTGEPSWPTMGPTGLQRCANSLPRNGCPRTGVNITADDLLILSGSQQGIDYAARLYLDEGDTVIVEHPSYLGALNTFSALRANYVSVDTDADGMRMDALEEALIANPRSKVNLHRARLSEPDGNHPGRRIVAAKWSSWRSNTT